MSGYDSAETSRYTGAPIQYIDFVTGSTTWRYTTADVTSSTFNGNSYTPLGIECSELEYTDRETSGDVTITVPRDTPVAALFQLVPPPLPVTVTVYQQHRSDTSSYITPFFGRVISAQFRGSVAILTCTPAAGVFARQIPRVLYQPRCNWAVYSAQCGAVKASFLSALSCTVVAGTTLTFATMATASGYFVLGWAELVATQERRLIIANAPPTIVLASPFPAGSIVAPQTINLYPGCNLTMGDCKNKFSRLVSFLGFPLIPVQNPTKTPVV